MGRKLIFWLTISVVLAGGCSKAQVVKSLKKIKPKPTPRATSQTLDGEHWSLDNQIGKVIVVSFWSTNCTESREWESWLKDVYEKSHPRDSSSFYNDSPTDDAEKRQHESGW